MLARLQGFCKPCTLCKQHHFSLAAGFYEFSIILMFGSPSKRKADDSQAPHSSTIKKGKCQSGKVKKGSFEHRFERRRYLNQLVKEFEATPEMECKQQVLANLANFAYDPYNYHFFQEIGVVSTFLAELSVNRNEALTEFAISGICNCSADRRIQKEIVRKQGLTIIKRYTYSTSIPIVLSAVTTLFNFAGGNLDEAVKSETFDGNLMDQLNFLRNHSDKRVQNVALVLIDELKS